MGIGRKWVYTCAQRQIKKIEISKELVRQLYLDWVLSNCFQKDKGFASLAVEALMEDI
jgi:hypothetical protein